MNYEELIYRERWLIEEVYRASDEILKDVSNTASFEKRVITKLVRFLELSNGNLTSRKYLKLIIRKELSSYMKMRYRKEMAVKFGEIDSAEDSEGNVIEYEPPDTLASVESGLEIKETIDLLAKDDRKKRFVLSEWANGNFNDSEISGMLAHTFGGNAASHRIFIQRFRTFCQRELATAI